MSEGMIGLVPLGEIRGVVDDLFGKLVGNEGPVFARELKRFVVKQPCWVLNDTPNDNAEFELTMTEAVDPIEMVRKDGYDHPEQWKFHGPAVTAPATKTFVLLYLGYCSNLADAKQKAEAQGFDLAEGQWREAFREKFRKPTRIIAVIFGKSEWVNSGDYRHVPCLHGLSKAWGSRFAWSDRDFGGLCHWVASRKSELFYHP